MIAVCLSVAVVAFLLFNTIAMAAGVPAADIAIPGTGLKISATPEAFVGFFAGLSASYMFIQHRDVKPMKAEMETLKSELASERERNRKELREEIARLRNQGAP